MVNVTNRAGAVAVSNEEAVRAWDTVLDGRWKANRRVFVGALDDVTGDVLHPPPVDGRCIDIGCGFGDTTQRLAQLVGPGGFALGTDSSARVIQDARRPGLARGRPPTVFVRGCRVITVSSGRFWTIRGMAQSFIGCDRDQSFLMPPDVRDWLAEDHLAWFVLDAVAGMELGEFYGLSSRFGGDSSVRERDGDAGAAEVDHRDQRVGGVEAVGAV